MLAIPAVVEVGRFIPSTTRMDGDQTACTAMAVTALTIVVSDIPAIPQTLYSFKQGSAVLDIRYAVSNN